MRIGIDLGGTKIEGLVARRQRRGTGAAARRHAAGHLRGDRRGVADLVRELETKVGARCSVGIGHPGAISPATGLIKNANSTRLNGHPLDRDLERRWSARGADVERRQLLRRLRSERRRGPRLPVVFGVILGTGVGGGIVIDGKPLVGAQAIAGEWGHNPLPLPRDDERPGPRCYCGRMGCIETWLSGPRLQRQFPTNTGRKLRATEIAEAAAAGDAKRPRRLELYCDRLARALADVINIIDPHAIVLGGGLSNMDALYGACPSCGATTSSPSPTISPPGCCRPCTAIRAACAAPRGCGRLDGRRAASGEPAR